jgi:prevent-host-death family protein
MTATLREGQIDLRRLVEIASRGEDVLITVDGLPKAKLTRAEASPSGWSAGPKSAEIAVWLRELDELRLKFRTGKIGLSSEEMLAEDRVDRI